MARSEARIATAIWHASDFVALPPTAQRLYLFLVSQADLAYTGVIGLRERRWSRTAAGLSVQDIRADLATLEAARFVLIDEDAEELLVRSFIRHDGVYRIPNVLRSAQKNLPAVGSPAIRTELARELRRVAAADDVPKGSVAIIEEMLAKLPNPSGNPSSKSSANPSGNPSDDPSADPSAKGQGERGVPSEPPFPEPLTSFVGANKSRRTRKPKTDSGTEDNAGRVVAAYVDGAVAAGLDRPAGSLPGRVGKQARQLLAQNVPLDKLVAAADAMGRSGWHDLAVQLQRSGAERNRVPAARAAPGAAFDVSNLTDDDFAPDKLYPWKAGK